MTELTGCTADDESVFSTSLFAVTAMQIVNESFEKGGCFK